MTGTVPDNAARRGVALGFLVLCLCVLAGRPALAGGITACESPFIFEGAAANIVPLEYAATAADTENADADRLERLQDTAQRLAWLFKLDSWHQPTYGSLGVVAHMFLGNTCDPDVVLDQLLVGGAAPPVRQGQILIVLQGRIFLEDEQIFVRSRVRGFRRGSDQFDYRMPVQMNYATETLPVRLGDTQQMLRASLPVLDVTFAPRIVTETLFNQINADFQEASKVFAQPDVNAPSDDLVFHADQPRAFSVRIIDRKGWIEIDDMFGGQPSHGFIRVNPEVSRSLHQAMPELDFLNGMLGFLRLQQTRPPSEFAPTPRRAPDLAEGALNRYLENALTAAEPGIRAMAHGMVGILQAAYRNDWPAARADFLRAAELAPTDTHYRNALGVTDTVLCCMGGDPGPYRDPARWFADAVSVDPQNPEAMANLLSFLEYLATSDSVPRGIDTTDLPATLDVVRKVAAQFPGLSVEEFQ